LAQWSSFKAHRLLTQIWMNKHATWHRKLLLRIVSFPMLSIAISGTKATSIVSKLCHYTLHFAKLTQRVRPQHLHAHIWNSVQTTHIRLHQAITRKCDNAASSLDSSTKRTSFKRLIVSTIMELLASVPQAAGYVQNDHVPPVPPPRVASSSSRSTSADQETHEPNGHTSIPQYNNHSLHYILYQLYSNGSELCLPQSNKIESNNV
jgi:hypothetical protein